MSFLQPLMLIALPLIALPIVIHLINQRRYQTTRWAAMIFLLAANRMSRGYAKLRQWLILATRMLVIAGLLFAVSRPLASGWLGLATGGRADTTIILLDRSPSMQQQGAGAVISKLEAGRQRLVETLAMLGSSRWVLIDSATKTPRELDSPEDLGRLPCAGPSSAEADLPAMLEAARDYIRANRTGRTEIWICSDLRANDWRADSRRWDALRGSFLEMSQGVRFHLLAYPQSAPDDLAVRVTDVRRQQSGQDAELLVSLLLSRQGDRNDKVRVPLRFEIEGARSELTVEMAGPNYRLKDHRIPLPATQKRGWGQVSIPADVNPGNDDFYFVFDQPPPRKTIVVAEDPQTTWPLRLAASVTPDRTVACTAEIVSVDQLATVPWEQVSLLLWQAPLPRGEAAKMTQTFVRRGGQALFFPPRSPDDAKLFGVAWQTWVAPPKELGVETWRGDEGLLAHTLAGQALQIGDLRIKRYCKMLGELTDFATLHGGEPLIGRVATDRGGVHFVATTPAPADSSLASDGVAIYVAVQRALALGSAVLGNARNLIAGRPDEDLSESWQRLAGDQEALSTDYAFDRGVYSAGDRLLAVNRPAGEDDSSVLTDERVAGLFEDLDFARLDDRVGDAGSLIQEIWRLFLVAMIAAMVGEAVLCLPKPATAKGVQP
jgi:hypothetical protein